MFRRVTRMFYFKGCNKCHGDLYLEEDLYGSFFKCLQCGRIVDLEMPEPGTDEGQISQAAKLAA